MSTDILPTDQRDIVNAGGTIVNRWAQVVEVVQPTFDAVVKVRASRQEWEALKGNDINAELAALPDKQWLEQAARLMDDAVRKPAPEGFYYLALGAMLQQIPSAKNVAPDFMFGVVDMILYDHDAWEPGCKPGFSAPVFISAIREARRSDDKDFVPGAAKILNFCQSNRKRFGQLGVDVECLVSLRHNAERELERQLRPPTRLELLAADDDDIPWGPNGGFR
jgi:hypothetical protein